MAKFLLIPHFEMHRMMLDQFEDVIHSEFNDTPITTDIMNVRFKGTLHALLPRDGYNAIEIDIPNFNILNKNEKDRLLNVLILINGQSGVRAPILIKLYEELCIYNAEILTKRIISENIFDGYHSIEESHFINYSTSKLTNLGNLLERTQVANNISNLFQKLSNFDYMYAIVSDEYSKIISTSNDEIYYEGAFYASLGEDD